jgi:spore coat protein U-like protein
MVVTMNAFSKLLTLSLLTGLSTWTFAATGLITGQVEVKLNVSTGCNVNGATTTDSGTGNKFGTLDFGKTSTTWSNVYTAELSNASNAGKLTVECEGADVPFSVSIDGGLRGDRTLKHITASDTVPYTIYRNSARTDAYVINQAQKFTAKENQATEVPIYGAIAANSTAKAQGDYTDTLTVNIAF